jgi:Alpha/beta hydrolase domain
MGRGRVVTSVVVVVAFALGGCSNDGASKARSLAGSTEPPSSTTPRSSGPAANLSEELHDGKGVFLPAGATADKTLLAPPPPAGYVMHEYVAAGTATSYRNAGQQTEDGRWTFVPDGSATYRTRIVVRRPADPKRFSGTVIVEWLNVSGGVDSAAEYDTTHEEIARSGDAWVGVSAQRIGVMGGPVLVEVPEPGGQHVAGVGLRAIDPPRYSSLDHPGDGFSFDIFTQVARALREGGAPLGGQKPRQLIAAGESQSAGALVTYINGVEPLTHAFDGYFVHSRGNASMPLAKPGEAVGFEQLFGAASAFFRTDQDTKILDIQTESDAGLLDALAARQPDDAHFRLWEMAGTAHADARLLGSTATKINCGVQVNNGPMPLIAKAALHALDHWVRTGTPPRRASRYEVTSDAEPQLRRDADGIVLGGVRTPLVDVPVDALSGVTAPDGPTVCILSGSTKPFTPERLAQLYASRADYLEKYNADLDRAVNAGHVMKGDRVAALAYAEPDRVTG